MGLEAQRHAADAADGVRAVLDVDVIVSALLAPRGAPAQVLRGWLGGEFELVVSQLLLDELRRALTYPKLSRYVREDEAAALLDLLQRGARAVADTAGPPSAPSRDPGDDYLVALGEQAKAVIVTGDHDLVALKGRLPIYTPPEILDFIRG